jgi:hypothetical protein
MRMLLRVGAVGLAAVLGAGGARAVPVEAFSDFGPHKSFAQGNGACVNGPANSYCLSGSSIFDASPFVAGVSGSLDHLDLAVSYWSGLNGVSVALVADKGGVPSESANALEEWVVTKLPTFTAGSPPVKATRVASKLHPSLVAGTTYWIVVMPLGFDTVAFVQPNDVAVSGGVWSDNGGQSWAGSLGTEPAFDVWVQ